MIHITSGCMTLVSGTLAGAISKSAKHCNKWVVCFAFPFGSTGQSMIVLVPDESPSIASPGLSFLKHPTQRVRLLRYLDIIVPTSPRPSCVFADLVGYSEKNRDPALVCASVVNNKLRKYSLYLYHIDALF